MKFTLIAALSENNVIGKGEIIPWKIPEDMKRFKSLTLNHSVIMGRKTYLSIPEKFRPLPQRKNIVMSKNFENETGIYIARSIQEAIDLAEDIPTYIIGGAEVYRQFLPLADNLEITRVYKNFEGDVYFPKVDWKNWKQIGEIPGQTEDGLKYSFLTFKRNI